jgi:Ni/Co efflux regulator RcnB
MRVLTIAIVAAFLALPATAPPAQACGAGMHSAKAATADYSAAKKKPKNQKKPKDEYMRAAPMK